MMIKLPDEKGTWVVRQLSSPGICSEASERFSIIWPYLLYLCNTVTKPNPLMGHNPEFRRVKAPHFHHTLLKQMR